MFDAKEVAETIERRRQWSKRLWCEETQDGVVYREVEASVQAMANRGFDTSRAERLLEKGEALYRAGCYDELLPVICEINQALRESPRVIEPQGAPADLEGIRATWPVPPPTPALDSSYYLDRVYGGWLGKNIGGALGGHLEGWTRRKIVERYGFVDDYLLKPPPTFNDDTTFGIIMLHALEEHGLEVSSAEMGREWVGHLPLEYCYTAERVAMQNLLRGITPPESGTLDNPFSEWVGGLMKGEVCGFIAPGRPDLAAEYAYRDGIIAHEREGVYGEIFAAAAISAAFVAPDAPSVIDTALRYVPPDSKYASVIRRTIEWCRVASSWQEACQRVEDSIGQEYHWVHVLPNAAILVIAVLLGEGDFTETVAIATTCGMDVDTNGGVVGTILGVLTGAASIPESLKDPIGDTIDTWVVGYERASLLELSRRTCAIGNRLVQLHG